MMLGIGRVISCFMSSGARIPRFQIVLDGTPFCPEYKLSIPLVPYPFAFLCEKVGHPVLSTNFHGCITTRLKTIIKRQVMGKFE
jgi:hypothetical protein